MLLLIRDARCGVHFRFSFTQSIGQGVCAVRKIAFVENFGENLCRVRIQQHNDWHVPVRIGRVNGIVHERHDFMIFCIAILKDQDRPVT